MANIAPEPQQIIEVAKWTQIMNLIKENQLTTAAILFVLWQMGAFISAYSYVQGGMC